MNSVHFNGNDFLVPATRFRGNKKVAIELDGLLQNFRDASEIGLHLGCGTVLFPGITNCDLHNPAAEKQLDSTDLSEFSDRSVCLIESHHMLEHLSFDEAKVALAEWRRVLKPGGLLVLTCPDLSAVCRLWLQLKSKRESTDERAIEEVNYVLKMFYGSQENEGMFHKSGYDAPFMRRFLGESDFEVLYSHTPYQIRTTPSLLTIAVRQ
ncbi:MAG: methyltransferase domain-containing protein [Planctomycetota bacterium]